MTEQDFPLRAIAPPAAGVLYGSAALLGVLAYATSPALGHFPGALVPWPAHGLTAAIVLAAPPALRTRVTLACAVALLLGLAPVAVVLNPVGGPARLIAAVTLLIAQAVAITLLYQRLTGGDSPLSGATAYATMLLSVVLAALPTTGLASLALRFSGGLQGTDYSGWAWWTAAASSSAALVGLYLALACRFREQRPLTPPRAVEFAMLAAVHNLALASAIAEVGPLSGHVHPALASLPFLVWAGLRFGRRGYALCALHLILWVTGAVWLHVGPFASVAGDHVERFRYAWVYVASLAGPGMIFPVALAERAAAARRSRDALAQLNAVFEGAGDLISAVDRELVIIAVNPAWRATFLRLIGQEVVPGMSVAEAHGSLTDEAETSEGYWRRALAGESFTIERTFGDPARGREEFEVRYAPVRDARGVVVGASQVIRSISDRRRRDVEQAEQRRLESLGRLAGGVAHDFNNILTAILGNAELLLGSLPDGDERRTDAIEIQNAARRASGLTQQLLAFARRREVQAQEVDVGASVRGMERLLRTLVGPAVEVRFDVAKDASRILIDPTQLEQVVMNLAVNARDAMPGGGTLGIEVAARDGEVRLVVRDSGEGMPADVQARVFEPFFTTKPQGKGTGLGLSTVHGIVHQAGGRIALESAPGAGTTFRITFPAGG